MNVLPTVVAMKALQTKTMVAMAVMNSLVRVWKGSISQLRMQLCHRILYLMAVPIVTYDVTTNELNTHSRKRGLWTLLRTNSATWLLIFAHTLLFLHKFFFIVCSYSRQFVFPISGNYLDYYRLMATTPRLVAIPFSDALALSYL